jgi:hypothetical protein
MTCTEGREPSGLAMVNLSRVLGDVRRSPRGPIVKSHLTLLVTALTVLVSCSKEDGDVTQKPEKVAESAAIVADTTTIEGVLKYYPQDIKSVQAWLGHEYMVGETPIRPTDSVSSETLRKKVGRTVKIDGVWNFGETLSRAKLTDDEAYMQTPSFSEGESAIRGSGINALSVLEVDE